MRSFISVVGRRATPKTDESERALRLCNVAAAQRRPWQSVSARLHARQALNHQIAPRPASNHPRIRAQRPGQNHRRPAPTTNYTHESCCGILRQPGNVRSRPSLVSNRVTVVPLGQRTVTFISVV